MNWRNNNIILSVGSKVTIRKDIPNRCNDFGTFEGYGRGVFSVGQYVMSPYCGETDIIKEIREIEPGIFNIYLTTHHQYYWRVGMFELPKNCKIYLNYKKPGESNKSILISRNS